MQIVVNAETKAPSDSKLLQAQASYYSNVLICLGAEEANPPLGDLLRLYYHLEGKWLIASPIHWEATHNDAMIIATDSALDLSEQESQAFFLLVREFLQAHAIECFYHDTYTWLLKVDNKPQITSQSVYTVLHRSLMPILNNLDKTLFWQRIITELQMYLSSHFLNTKRQNQLSVNGLWFWGEGKLKLNKKNVLTNDELILSLPQVKAAEISSSSEPLVLDKQMALFIKYPQQIDMAAWQAKVKKYTVQWYWNNLAYLRKPACFLFRWWRS